MGLRKLRSKGPGRKLCNEYIFKVNHSNISLLFQLIDSNPRTRCGLTFVNTTTKILDAAKF